MRIGTLFSGIGAPEQAAARVWPNHEIAFACEMESINVMFRSIYKGKNETQKMYSMRGAF